MSVDLEEAGKKLEEAFERVQLLILGGSKPHCDHALLSPIDVIISTSIQGYREALLGIVLVRILERKVNLRLPYVSQGARAYNGRDLDEQVINPFLQRHRIPSSRGPYLAMFRRDFRFEKSRRSGQRDKRAFDSFLDLISALEQADSEVELSDFLDYLLYNFSKLRESAEVPLSRLQRISLEQFDNLVGSLLSTPSGGRFPVILVVAALRAIKDYFGIAWVVNYQGINVADAPSGAGGDITVTQDGRIVFAAEVTERPVDRTRVAATFNAKIAPNGIEDYLFFVRPETLKDDARQQGRQYFAQGHEIAFIDIKDWILAALATMGKSGRDLFNRHMIDLIDDSAIPRALKVAWNDHIAALTS